MRTRGSWGRHETLAGLPIAVSADRLKRCLFRLDKPGKERDFLCWHDRVYVQHAVYKQFEMLSYHNSFP